MEPTELIGLIDELKFKKINYFTEVDEYFTDIESNYIKNRTCLRIRKQGQEKLEVTFKGKSQTLLGQYCKLENNICSHISEYDNFVSLFSSLGYYSYVSVFKERLVYELRNGKYIYSIMIDKLPEIGGFVEFEIISDKDNSNKKNLQEELNNFVKKFQSLNLKEALEPYRDLVAKQICRQLLTNKECHNLYLNIDIDILNYEKKFFKKYKTEISKVCNQNVKWGLYKKNREIDNKITELVDEYLDNLIFDNQELLVMLELLKKINYRVTFITKVNELFFTHLFGKLNVSLDNVIYLHENSISHEIKKRDISLTNSLIICNKSLKEINSILLIIINNYRC